MTFELLDSRRTRRRLIGHEHLFGTRRSHMIAHVLMRSTFASGCRNFATWGGFLSITECLRLGEEMQHDTSPHEVTIGGKKRKAQTASGVLCYSRMLFFQIYPTFRSEEHTSELQSLRHLVC